MQPDGFGGDIYEGDWIDDERHGKGTLSMANGDVYQGEWRNNLKHGPGTYFYEATQKRYVGRGGWFFAHMVSGLTVEPAYAT